MIADSPHLRQDLQPWTREWIFCGALIWHANGRVRITLPVHGSTTQPQRRLQMASPSTDLCALALKLDLAQCRSIILGDRMMLQDSWEAALLVAMS
jgi:hypothetical protein